MNLLFIADPGSVHDLHWMEAMSTHHRCYLLVRKHHASRIDPSELQKRRLTLLGTIDDFSLRKFMATRKTAQFITDCIKSHRIDLVHLLYAEPNALWAVFRKRFGCPVVLTTRGTDILQTIPAFARKRSPFAALVATVYKRALNQCDAITSTSHRQQLAIKEFIPGISENKLMCIRTGIDIAAIDRANTIASDKPHVLFPRLMQPIYNHECAIEAIGLLEPGLRSSHRFVFLDANTSNQAYKARIAERLDALKADVLWLSRLSEVDLFGWMKGASAVVMTPHSDGTSVSAMEAIAAGVPVLLPDLGYDADLFSDAAIFFTPNSAADLATKLSEVLQQPDPTRATANAVKMRSRAARSVEMARLETLYLSLRPS